MKALTLDKLIAMMRARFPTHTTAVLVDAANDLLYNTANVPSYFRPDHWAQLISQMSPDFIDRFRNNNCNNNCKGVSHEG